MNQETEQQFLQSFGAGEADDALLTSSVLDDFELGELSPATISAMATVASRGLHEVFHYCFSGRPLDEKGLTIATRRFVSIAWMLHSEMLVGEDGAPLALRELAALPQIDCTKCTMSVLAQAFGKQFNFRSRIQKREGAKANYAAAAKKGWEKRTGGKPRPQARETPRPKPSPKPKAPKPQKPPRTCRRCKERRPVRATYLCIPCRAEIDANAAERSNLLAHGKKKCTRCSEVKDTSDFVEGGLRCYNCRLAVNRECRARTKAKIRTVVIQPEPSTGDPE